MMFDLRKIIKQEPVFAVLLTVPLVIFGVLLLFPKLDAALWFAVPYEIYAHYYMSAFSGFVALIVAFYSSSLSDRKIDTRLRFITLAFALLAAMMLLSALFTPGVYFNGTEAKVAVWALYLSLPIGAVFFALAGVRWSPAGEAWLEKYLTWWGLGVVGLLVLLMWLVTAVSPPIVSLNQSPMNSAVTTLLTISTIGLYIWSAQRIRTDFVALYTFGHRLSLTLLLLVEAQFFLVVGRDKALSGHLFYPQMMLALFVAVWAILSALRNNEDLQVSRYFAASGSVIIVGFSLVLGEFVISLFDLQAIRPAILLTLLAEGVLSFLILYVIVAHLERLVRQRTVDFRREQRLRAELTQMVIHDLKSPLTVIRSSISMVTKGNLGAVDARQQKILRRADESTQRILQLIDNLLDVERLEVGALMLRRAEIQSAIWLQDSLAHWEVVAGAQNKSLTIDVPDTLPPLWGDGDLLQRVINNLLTNALNYSSMEGLVNVAACVEGNELTLYVADDGPGVPDADKARIFEKFAQVEGTERRGTGLGLTFCKMVVEAHQGTLAVADSPDGGAVFRMGLPICQNGDHLGQGPNKMEVTRR